jgi:hypothetical protein
MQQRTEYSFNLYTCNLSDRTRPAVHPITRARLEIPVDDGLTPTERQALRVLFDEYGIAGQEPHGEGYAWYLPENGSVRLRGGPDLEATGQRLGGFAVEITVKRLTDEVLAFVLRAAREGNLALMSFIGDRVRLVNESSDPRIKKRWPDAKVIATVEALRSWLENEIGGRRVSG